MTNHEFKEALDRETRILNSRILILVFAFLATLVPIGMTGYVYLSVITCLFMMIGLGIVFAKFNRNLKNLVSLRMKAIEIELWRI